MLPEPGPIAKRAAQEALANVGVQEVGGNNRGKAVETYLASVGCRPGDPWCAAFVRFRFENAADDIDLTLPTDFPDSGYTPDYKRWAKNKGVWTPMPEARTKPELVQVGDLACFYFPAKQRIAHIGIVVGLFTGGAILVEGNTGPDSGTEVQRDGDGVFKKRRNFAALGTLGGFCRCAF
jgi:hypothetical protein